tara:strand:+ start:34722 stop:35501 length:780 start_codon:yes stop_codon:yes gene_type:complete
MKQIDENLIVEEYNTNKKSTHQIAQDFNTYPNKIRRILQKNGVDLRSKSQAQSVAIESGRAEHPTKGKPRTEEQKLQTSKNMEKYWENISDADRKKFSKKAKDRWEAMSSEEHLLMRQKAGEALRKTTTEGSKAEKFLYQRLQKEGYDAIIHKKGLIEGQKFEIDIFLPELGIAIEIDGPQHFTPMFGEEHLRNYVKYDSIKNGLLVQKGFCVIRVKYLCKHISESIKRKLWNLVFPVVQKLENKFPPKSKRIIELEIS